jgi:bis(5'-nucleosidyl)-tetraphosphatase
MPVEKSAGAVVFYRAPQGKIEYLILEHRAGHWGFPKGLIEKGEKLEETALRECREETGLDKLSLISGFKETIRYFFKVKFDYQVKERGFKMGQNVMKFVTYFLVESKSKKVKLSFEHLNYVWLELDAALENIKKHNQSNQVVLKKANDFLNRVSKEGLPR